MADGLEKFHQTQLKAVLAKLNELGFEEPKKISLKQNEFSFLVKNNAGVQFEFKFLKTNILSIELEPNFSWIRSIVQVSFAFAVANWIIAHVLLIYKNPISGLLLIPMVFLVLIILNIIRDKMYKSKYAISLKDLKAKFQSFA